MNENYLKLKADPLLLWRVVSRAVDITEFIPYQRSNIYCPFHDDTNKPSAMFKVADQDQIEKIHCFVCNKQYTSYDYIKRILELKPIDYLFDKVPDLLIGSLIKEGLVFKITIYQETKAELTSLWKVSNQDFKLFLKNVYKEVK